MNAVAQTCRTQDFTSTCLRTARSYFTSNPQRTNWFKVSVGESPRLPVPGLLLQHTKTGERTAAEHNQPGARRNSPLPHKCGRKAPQKKSVVRLNQRFEFGDG